MSFVFGFSVLMEVPCQLEFNCSNKVQMKLLKEVQASKIRVQNRREDANKQLLEEPPKAVINNRFHNLCLIFIY